FEHHCGGRGLHGGNLTEIRSPCDLHGAFASGGGGIGKETCNRVACPGNLLGYWRTAAGEEKDTAKYGNNRVGAGAGKHIFTFSPLPAEINSTIPQAGKIL
ncbi:MAG TPA: hypothetical protein DCY59_01650, partial [Micrococcaceae bacterium]|nr:hypothetical protein [Micrococcaceae bacterium]